MCFLIFFPLSTLQGETALLHHSVRAVSVIAAFLLETVLLLLFLGKRIPTFLVRVVLFPSFSKAFHDAFFSSTNSCYCHFVNGFPNRHRRQLQEAEGLFAELVITTKQGLLRNTDRATKLVSSLLLSHVICFSHVVLCFGFYPNYFPFWAHNFFTFFPWLFTLPSGNLLATFHGDLHHCGPRGRLPPVRNNFGFQRLRFPFWFQSPRIFSSSSRCLPCSLTIGDSRLISST